MYTELSLKEVGTGANRPPDFFCKQQSAGIWNDYD